LNYDYTTIYAAGGTGPGRLTDNGASQAQSCSLGASGYGGGGKIIITDYVNTNLYKTESSACSAGGPGSDYAWNFSSEGIWHNTATITSITLSPEGTNFAVGDTVSIYGTN
jgi:hypothetical protein